MKTINYILLTAIALSFSSCMQQLKEKKKRRELFRRKHMSI